MDALPVIATTLGAAFSATLGVLVGGAVTRRTQERHWLRDKQLRAYEDLYAQHARIMMALQRSHLDRTPADVDWAAWSVAMTFASLVAPLRVGRAIDAFGRAMSGYLDAVATRNPVADPLDSDGLTAASRPVAVAHLALLNTIRGSLGGSLEPMPFYLGGTLGGHPEGTEFPRDATPG